MQQHRLLRCWFPRLKKFLIRSVNCSQALKVFFQSIWQSSINLIYQFKGTRQSINSQFYQNQTAAGLFLERLYQS